MKVQNISFGAKLGGQYKNIISDAIKYNDAKDKDIKTALNIIHKAVPGQKDKVMLYNHSMSVLDSDACPCCGGTTSVLRSGVRIVKFDKDGHIKSDITSDIDARKLSPKTLLYTMAMRVKNLAEGKVQPSEIQTYEYYHKYC